MRIMARRYAAWVFEVLRPAKPQWGLTRYEVDAAFPTQVRQGDGQAHVRRAAIAALQLGREHRAVVRCPRGLMHTHAQPMRAADCCQAMHALCARPI